MKWRLSHSLTKGDYGPENRSSVQSIGRPLRDRSPYLPILGSFRFLAAVRCAICTPSTTRFCWWQATASRPSIMCWARGIPGKGKILTQISLFWFDLLSDIVPNHVITADVKEFPASLQPFRGAVGRPLDAGEARHHVSRGMRGARISSRVRLEGLSIRRKSVRHRIAGRPRGWIAASGPLFYAGDQKPGRGA